MKKISVISAALAMSALLVAPAADASVAAAGPGGTFAGYATPVVVSQQGERLDFTNLDIDAHDIVSDDRATGSEPWCIFHPQGACPLFASKLIGLGETDEVIGVDYLLPGSYKFICSVHPWMQGTLIVS